MEQQSTPPNRGTKRGSVASNEYTPSKALKHTSGSVHDQSEMNALPLYCINGLIQNCAKFTTIRRQLYIFAEAHGAFYGRIYYDRDGNNNISEQSGLRFDLLFIYPLQAQQMDSSVRSVALQRNLSVMTSYSQGSDYMNRFGAASDVPVRIYKSDYSTNESPMRVGWESVHEDYAVSSATTVVPDEQLQYEFIMGTNKGAYTPQSCHIIPSAECTGGRQALDKDPNNRILLEPNLHKFYDQTNPRVSFYSADAPEEFNTHDPCKHGRRKVRLVAFFKETQTAEQWYQNGFRCGDHREGSHEVSFTIEHKDPLPMINLLNERHAKNMEAMGFPLQHPQLSQDVC